ncbi:hypothetical protein M0805_008405 [Coniferiporia weirii]|nr:hypothetical protein M0805_008405 [Coniferiporia weirii]
MFDTSALTTPLSARSSCLYISGDFLPYVNDTPPKSDSDPVIPVMPTWPRNLIPQGYDGEREVLLHAPLAPPPNYCDAEKTDIKYNRGDLSRKLTIVGLAISSVFGATCIVIGVLLRSQSLPMKVGTYVQGNLHFNFSFPYVREIMLLLLNVTFVKLALWSTGSAHELALKWKLAYEDDKQSGTMRLEFNANLRFVQSSYEWWSANGIVSNVIMALCLTVSYASSSMVLLSLSEDVHYNAVVSFVALISLGTAILLQVIIAAWAISTTHIPTWSQSPFDTAAALVAAGRLKRIHGRCMYSLYDKYHVGPIKPRRRQVPVWDSSPQFRTFVMYIWMLVAAGYLWLFIIWAMIQSGTQGAHPGTSWALIPGEETASMNFGWNGEVPTAGLLWGLGILVGFQGGIITTALTCIQMLAALVRDERLWREAATERGSDPAPGPFKAIFISWQNMAIHAADPIAHWLFGLAVSVDAKSGFQVCPVQILYVTVFGTAGVILITAVGRFRPRTNQPSTYGHLQTLTNLVDEWHGRMFWGHKGVSIATGIGDEDVSLNTRIGHAGTGCRPLRPVIAEMTYGCPGADDC